MPSHGMIGGCGLESPCQASEHAPRDKTGWAEKYAFRLRETTFFFNNSFLKGWHISKSSVSSTPNDHWLWKVASLSCRMLVFEIMSTWCIPLHNWTEMAWIQNKSKVRGAHLQSRIWRKVVHDGSLGCHHGGLGAKRHFLWPPSSTGQNPNAPYHIWWRFAMCLCSFTK